MFHGAGLVGSGNASYIDEVILRNKDADTAWTSASDGTLEERLYYMHNWRHDVSLVVTSGARIVQYVKYYSYGRPFGMPAGDCDSFGSNTANDFTIIGNWIFAATWDARGDLNTDGTVNATDAGLFPSETMGTGVLSRSDVQSRGGYAGYQHARNLAATKWQCGIGCWIAIWDAGRDGTRWGMWMEYLCTSTHSAFHLPIPTRLGSTRLQSPLLEGGHMVLQVLSFLSISIQTNLSLSRHSLEEMSSVASPSDGFLGFTFGCQACTSFDGGGWQVECGYGVGNGTGVALTGRLSCTRYHGAPCNCAVNM